MVLLGFSLWLVVTYRVPLKMLPFDNKNELQVVIDMPEGTTLENTEAAAHALAETLVRVPEVTDVSTYVGTSSPVDFNGLIRHYYLRHGANDADIRINFIEKTHREQQSHPLALRLRNGLKGNCDGDLTPTSRSWKYLPDHPSSQPWWRKSTGEPWGSPTGK